MRKYVRMRLRFRADIQIESSNFLLLGGWKFLDTVTLKAFYPRHISSPILSKVSTYLSRSSPLCVLKWTGCVLQYVPGPVLGLLAGPNKGLSWVRPPAVGPILSGHLLHIQPEVLNPAQVNPGPFRFIKEKVLICILFILKGLSINFIL